MILAFPMLLGTMRIDLDFSVGSVQSYPTKCTVHTTSSFLSSKIAIRSFTDYAAQICRVNGSMIARHPSCASNFLLLAESWTPLLKMVTSSRVVGIIRRDQVSKMLSTGPGT